MEPSDRQRQEIEVKVTADQIGPGELFVLGPPTMFACPECQGVLMKVGEEPVPMFRCHTGHSFSEPALLGAMNQDAEIRIFQAIRSFQEVALLLNDIGGRYKVKGELRIAEAMTEKGREALERAGVLYNLERSWQPPLIPEG